MARPKRFELLTPRFVVWCSIQLSYGRALEGGRTYASRCGNASTLFDPIRILFGYRSGAGKPAARAGYSNILTHI
jgi:hypothetical protein